MKNLLILLIYATLISFSSCNTVINEVDNECILIENDFVLSAQLALADFESNMKAALNESNNFDDFRNNLKENEEDSKFELLAVKLKSASGTINEEDSLARKFLDDFKASIYIEFDGSNVEGSRDEFLSFLDQKKQEFQSEVVSLNFLDQQEMKDILVAQMFYEVGLLELLIEYSDAISTLGQNFDPDNNLKSISSCNWWCMTKLYVKCQLLSCGAILSFSATTTPASFLAWAAGTGLSYLAIDCWIEYYTNLWGIIGL